MTTALRSAALLGLVAFAGCASTASSPASTAGQVKRTITCREKPGVDPTAVFKFANDFAKVNGVLDVSVGRGQAADGSAATRPGEVTTFSITFRDAAAAGRADTDTAYAYVRDNLLPATATDIRTSDVTLQNYLVSEQFTEETTAATRERRAAAIKQQTELINRSK